MRRSIYTLCCLLLLQTGASAQFSRYVVQFTNKAGTPFSISNPSAYLSQKAIARRTRYGIAIDSSDLPVTPRYIDSIRLAGSVTILNISKWLNQVLIQTTDAAALTKIGSFSFVRAASPVGNRLALNPVSPSDKFSETVNPLPPGYGAGQRSVNDFYNYGNSFGQVHIHEGEFLHNKGYRGRGITIAVFDAGFFGYLTNPVFDSIRNSGRVLGTWDFVTREAGVNEDHPHGMQCLSSIAANRPGAFVGTGPEASFYLFRTEDAATETPVEEQNWAAAAELADSLGVDMISCSLGYDNFDNPIFNHSYAQRDGNTTMITRAADLAAKKGIMVMNSAGNSGNSVGLGKFVSCPADGDSVVAVAACDVNGNIAGFSSWGPNGAGKQKPNITSVGAGAVISGFDGSPGVGNGTSFSNPNVAGLIACLWQAFPEFSNMKLLDAVQKSSHLANNPNDRFGYGIPNFRKAYSLLKKEQNLVVFGADWLKVTPVIFEDTIRVDFIAQLTGNITIQLIDAAGLVVASKAVNSAEAEEIYTVLFNNLNPLPAGDYTVKYADGTNSRSVAVRKVADFLSTILGNNWIKAYPVPFRNNSLIIFIKAPQTAKATLKLVDALGRTIETRSTDLQQGQYYSIQFDKTAALSAGVYYVEFSDGKNRKTLKVSKF
jgi:serine protease AprX